MANRFWVGGTSTWNATAGTKWALTSGGAGGQAVPTASDDVFFDASSGAVTVTLGSTGNCRSLSFTGFTGTFAGSSQLNIGTSTSGSLTIATGMGITYTGDVVFVSTTTGNNITTNGKTIFSNFIFNGSGTWTLQDNLTLDSSSSVGLNNGALNINNKNVTAGIFDVEVNISLGSSLITVGEFDVGLGAVVSAGTSTIATSILNDINSTAYNSVAISGSASVISGNCTFSTLTLQPNANITFTSGSILTIATLSATGSAGNTITIQTEAPGSAFTFSKASNNVVCDYLVMQDCHSTGGANFYAGSHSTNNGNNTGWIFGDPGPPAAFDSFFMSGD